MPNETRNYVPKLLAVRNIVTNPQSFGMNVSEITNQPYFKALDLDKPIDQSMITRLAGISESEFLALNPAFNAPVFIPKANRKLLLPAAAASAFEKNYRNEKPEYLLSWDVYTSSGNTSLNSIAAETGMSVAEIKRLNGMSSNSLSAGRSILVAKNSLSGNRSTANINFIDTDNTPDTYRSNMPEMAPVQIVQTTPAVQQPQAAPVNFINQASNVMVEPVRTAANATATQPINIEPVAVATVIEPQNTATVASTTATAAPQASAPVTVQTESAISSLASNLIQESPVTATSTVAINEPLPLPTQSRLVEETENDSLMSLVEDSTLRQSAAETVRNTITQAEAQEAAEKAR